MVMDGDLDPQSRMNGTLQDTTGNPVSGISGGMNAKQQDHQLEGTTTDSSASHPVGADSQLARADGVRGRAVSNVKYWISVVGAEWPRIQAASLQRCEQLWHWTWDGAVWRQFLIATVAAIGISIFLGLVSLILFTSIAIIISISFTFLLTVWGVCSFTVLFLIAATLITFAAISLGTLAIASAVLGAVTFTLCCSGAVFSAYSSYRLAAAVKFRISAMLFPPKPTLTMNSLHLPEIRVTRASPPSDRKELGNGWAASKAPTTEQQRQEMIDPGTPVSPLLSPAGSKGGGKLSGGMSPMMSPSGRRTRSPLKEPLTGLGPAVPAED